MKSGGSCLQEHATEPIVLISHLFFLAIYPMSFDYSNILDGED
jgi:hypothetical protein